MVTSDDLSRSLRVGRNAFRFRPKSERKGDGAHKWHLELGSTRTEIDGDVVYGFTAPCGTFSFAKSDVNEASRSAEILQQDGTPYERGLWPHGLRCRTCFP